MSFGLELRTVPGLMGFDMLFTDEQYAWLRRPGCCPPLQACTCIQKTKPEINVLSIELICMSGWRRYLGKTHKMIAHDSGIHVQYFFWRLEVLLDS